MYIIVETLLQRANIHSGKEIREQVQHLTRHQQNITIARFSSYFFLFLRREAQLGGRRKALQKVFHEPREQACLLDGQGRPHEQGYGRDGWLSGHRQIDDAVHNAARRRQHTTEERARFCSEQE